MVVEIAKVDLPNWLLEIMRAQTKRALDASHALLAVAEVHFPIAGIGNGVGIVGVVSDRSFGLGDRRSVFIFVLETPRLRHVRPLIVGTNRQGGVSCFLSTVKI